VNAASADVSGEIVANGSGWLLARAYAEDGSEDVLDIYPYATTSPIYVVVDRRPRRSHAAAHWALQWLDRLQMAARANADYRSSEERDLVLRDIARAREFYETCARGE
jgi:hypothetical protein